MTDKDWTDWDRTLAILDAIQMRALTVQHDADKIAEFIGMLDKTPPFETNAGDQLKRAELAAMTALTLIHETRAKLEQKIPVMAE